MLSYNKDFFQESKCIIVQNDRFFIDICFWGCGSGCSYCYAPKHNEKQCLLNLEQIKCICEYIKNRYDCHQKIISLCPNTEPLKSKQSISLVLYIIDFFRKQDCYIQISTKEIIPSYFLDEIKHISNSKIYINISIPMITNSDVVEPNAATYSNRFNNFKLINYYSDINFCLYIKPLIQIQQDQETYVKNINFYNISKVIIGPTFDKNAEIPCVSLYDKNDANKILQTQSDYMDGFIKLLRSKTKAQVYGSSVCVIYNDFKKHCVLKLSQFIKSACEDCSLLEECNYGKI